MSHLKPQFICRLGQNFSLYFQAGKIYVADYTYVAPIKRNTNPDTTDKSVIHEKFVVPNCIGLFHSTSSVEFLPIAIQLGSDKQAPIFTPADAEYDWLLAKMFFRTTQSCIHEVLNVLSPIAFIMRYTRYLRKRVLMMGQKNLQSVR